MSTSNGTGNGNGNGNGNSTTTRQRLVTNGTHTHPPTHTNGSTASPPSKLSPQAVDQVRHIISQHKNSRHIAPVNPILDMILTTIYVILSVACLWMFIKEGIESIGLFLILILAVHINTHLVRSIVNRVGRWFSSTFLKHAPFNDPLRKKNVLSKFSDTAWQLTIHGCMSFGEYRLLCDEPWWNDTTTVWTPHPREQHHSFGLRLIYIAQLAVWVYMGFSHRFIESRRKDYVVMFIHHIITIILVGGSYTQGYLRMGLLVLIVHEIPDIFVDLMKMANYCKLENKQGFFLSELIFTINIVVWAYCRLYMLPFHVIHASLIVGHQVMSRLNGLDPSFWNNWSPYPLYIVCNTLLVLLVGLHIYWFALFLRILYKVITKGAHEAGAEEYEGESGSGDSSDCDEPSRH